MQTRERWKMRKAVVRFFVCPVGLTITGRGQGPNYMDILLNIFIDFITILIYSNVF